MIIILSILIALICIYFYNNFHKINGNEYNQKKGTGHFKPYNFKKQPKVIKSKDISSFKLDFEDRYTVDDSKLPSEKYHISLEKTEDGGKIYYSFENEKTIEKDFTLKIFNEKTIENNVPLEVFKDLQKLIEEENVEEINGYHFENTALGYVLNLEIIYESGEKISAYAKGGRVQPPGFNGKKLVEFFYEMVEEEEENKEEEKEIFSQ